MIKKICMFFLRLYLVISVATAVHVLAAVNIMSDADFCNDGAVGRPYLQY